MHIYSDCQSAIQAIGGSFTDSQIVLKCHKLAVTAKVSIHYVKAHCGIQGNEEADEAANIRTAMEVEGPEPFIGLLRSRFNGIIKDLQISAWQKRWRSSDESYYHQTKPRIP